MLINNPSNVLAKEFSMKKQKEEEIPPTEDLMREHGILNRILLIYEEIMRRIQSGPFPKKPLVQTLSIIQIFIENYHEKLEEQYIFPIFEKAKLKNRLIKTLRTQHIKGREITKRLLEITSSSDKELSLRTKKNLVGLLKKFITMYRPHEAREDTVLFPLVRSLISQKEFNELGEKFEDLEHELFGQEGFQTIVKKVENIEKELEIYRLEQFTPTLNNP